jgi:CubicO group peptidase (beta-lactamase class C family)
MKRAILLGLMLPAMFLWQGCRRDSRIEEIDRVCSALFPDNEPGAAVLVMEKDRILFDRGYGLADLETGTAIDGNTFFNIASVSKQFTAVAVLQLAEKGLLDPEAPVPDYFPEYTDPIWKDIRIRHLLSHSSGIPDGRGYLSREEKIAGDENIAIEYLASLNELHFAPGTAYEYINPTFVLLGKLVERVSGHPFTDYVRDHIFLPSGMTETLYFDRDHQERIPRMAHGYEYADVTDMPEERTAGMAPEKKDWYEYDFGEETFFATRPDGGIYTSTHEFAKWEQALRKGTVLQENRLSEAWTPQTVVTGSPWSDYQNRTNTAYGYGWFIEPETAESPLRIYHTGDNCGFKILAARYPATETLLLIFANRADWDRYDLFMKLEKILIK